MVRPGKLTTIGLSVFQIPRLICLLSCGFASVRWLSSLIAFYMLRMVAEDVSSTVVPDAEMRFWSQYRSASRRNCECFDLFFTRCRLISHQPSAVADGRPAHRRQLRCNGMKQTKFIKAWTVLLKLRRPPPAWSPSSGDVTAPEQPEAKLQNSKRTASHWY